MPVIDVGEEQHQSSGGNFGYSAASIADLEEVGTTEYTLATIVVDESSSVNGFRVDMESAMSAALDSWRKHPRSKYLLVRLVTFANDVREQHGFRLLSQCPDSYTGSLNPSGMTALYKAVVSSVEAAKDYASRLAESYFLVNAITLVITDGMDNRGGAFGLSASSVKDALDSAVQLEGLESHVGILVGVNVQDPEARSYLAKFEADSGFSQYVELENASAETLAKLGQFMARSVSSQSQSLGTGGPSQPLSF